MKIANLRITIKERLSRCGRYPTKRVPLCDLHMKLIVRKHVSVRSLLTESVALVHAAWSHTATSYLQNALVLIIRRSLRGFTRCLGIPRFHPQDMEFLPPKTQILLKASRNIVGCRVHWGPPGARNSLSTCPHL